MAGERHDAGKTQPFVHTHGREPARHERNTGRATSDGSWSDAIAGKSGLRPHEGLRAAPRRTGVAVR